MQTWLSSRADNVQHVFASNSARDQLVVLHMHGVAPGKKAVLFAYAIPAPCCRHAIRPGLGATVGLPEDSVPHKGGPLPQRQIRA